MPASIVRWTVTVAVSAVSLGLGIAIDQIAPDAKPADWLSLAGAFIGAGLAVLGGLSVVDYQQRLRQRARIDFVAEALSEIEDVAQIIRLYADAEYPKPSLEHFYSVIDRARSAFKRLEKVQGLTAPDTISLLKTYEECSALGGDAWAQLSHQAHANGLYGDIGRVPAPQLAAATDPILWHVRRALKLARDGK